MMRFPICIHAELFASETDRERSQRALVHLLDALVSIDRDYLRAYTRTPNLYASGVRYMREEDKEDWLAVPAILKMGGGDCEDLACWRAAELLNSGIRCRPFLRWRRYEGDFYLYHVLVQYADGGMEDPSRKLGMGSDLS